MCPLAREYVCVDNLKCFSNVYLNCRRCPTYAEKQGLGLWLTTHMSMLDILHTAVFFDFL